MKVSASPNCSCPLTVLGTDAGPQVEVERSRACLLIFVFLSRQIFFLLFGALYGSIDGYIRRVGYTTNCRKIQQRLLPMLPLTAVFRLPGDEPMMDKGLFKSRSCWRCQMKK